MILTAERVGAGTLDAATVLVIDVLRASTTIVAAVAAGCRALVPVRDAEEARRRAAAYAPAPALLAGERRGEPLEGFDLGNSPLEFCPERVGGRTVLLTTSNGTRALLAVRKAAAVGVAGFVNLEAAAGWANAQGRDVALVCAGERGAVSLEDQVCAGLLVERLAARRPPPVLSARAREARRIARPYARDVGRLREDSSWARHLRRSGRADDVEACLALDTARVVPLYRAGVDEIGDGCR